MLGNVMSDSWSLHRIGREVYGRELDTAAPLPVSIPEDIVLFFPDKSNKSVDNVMNLLCLMAKFHIHKVKCLQTLPNIYFIMTLRYFMSIQFAEKITD